MTNGFLREELLLIATLATVTAIVTLVLHLLFGRMWAGNELARRVMGHAEVLVIIGVAALYGYLDFFTWLVMCIVTIVAGGIVGAIEVTEQERRRVAYVNELKKWAANLAVEQAAEGQGDDGTDFEDRE